jgi:hypothetical protein
MRLFIALWYSKCLIVVGCIILTLLCLSSICPAEEGKWTRKADMPTARVAVSAITVNEEIHVIGDAAGESIPE